MWESALTVGAKGTSQMWTGSNAEWQSDVLSRLQMNEEGKQTEREEECANECDAKWYDKCITGEKTSPKKKGLIRVVWIPKNSVQTDV